MTKKRLSDLISEEMTSQNSSEVTNSENKEVNPPKRSLSSSSSRMTKAQLQKQVEELTDALETAQKGNESLNDKITELEITVQEKEAQIQALEAQLTKLKGSEDTLKSQEDQLKEQKTKIETLTSQLQGYQDLSAQLAEK